MSFTVGIPRRIPMGEILVETLSAIAASSIPPSRVIIVDNGEVPLSRLDLSKVERSIHVVRPETNLGCAASWNLLHKLSRPAALVLLNDDCAVAPDTFEKMLAYSSETIVCAYGFSCVRIDPIVWSQIGDFDESFFPAYFEDTDYRYRAKLAGVTLHEWDTFPREKIVEGRERSAQGIVHGKPEPAEYKSLPFKARVEANKARYAHKWGGEPGYETHVAPFGGLR